MSRRRLLLGLACLCALHAVSAEVRFRDLDDPDAPKWAEDEVVLPAFPQEGNLLPFYVGEMTSHRFFIDGPSLSVGKDGVVRYVLVVRTGGGATNVSFEGIHCERREFKIFASGRSDGTWANVRKGEWRRIENKPVNRYHVALWRDFLCPYSGTPIGTPDEGRNALRLGKHPHAM